MSGPHAHPSLWMHDEESGGYVAEINGFTLVVSWTPNQPDQRGYFTWRATREGEDGETTKGEEHFEEMELAMADAEAFAG